MLNFRLNEANTTGSLVIEIANFSTGISTDYCARISKIISDLVTLNAEMSVKTFSKKAQEISEIAIDTTPALGAMKLKSEAESFLKALPASFRAMNSTNELFEDTKCTVDDTIKTAIAISAKFDTYKADMFKYQEEALLIRDDTPDAVYIYANFGREAVCDNQAFGTFWQLLSPNYCTQNDEGDKNLRAKLSGCGNSDNTDTAECYTKFDKKLTDARTEHNQGSCTEEMISILGRELACNEF